MNYQKTTITLTTATAELRLFFQWSLCNE